MYRPLRSAISALVVIGFACGTATSADSEVFVPASVAISTAPAFTGADLLAVQGPSSATFSVVLFDDTGNGQEVAAGSLNDHGVAIVLTPEAGGAATGAGFFEVRVSVGNGIELVTQVPTLDPLFLWQ